MIEQSHMRSKKMVNFKVNSLSPVQDKKDLTFSRAPNVMELTEVSIKTLMIREIIIRAT